MTAHPISARTPLVTNGFEVLLPETVEILARDFPDGAEVKAERERVRIVPDDMSVTETSPLESFLQVLRGAPTPNHRPM